jgi:hypothetical protein
MDVPDIDRHDRYRIFVRGSKARRKEFYGAGADQVKSQTPESAQDQEPSQQDAEGTIRKPRAAMVRR